MIGILLALQVNNWNEKRKNNKEAIEILDKIKQDLITTKFDVELDIKRHGDCLIAAKRIYTFLNTDEPYYDSLDLFFNKLLLTILFNIQTLDTDHSSHLDLKLFRINKCSSTFPFSLIPICNF